MENTKSYNRAFLTGCDHTGEWLLPWFIKNIRKHNNTPIVFADFGVKNISAVDADLVIDLKNSKERGWFKKPRAILECPSEQTVWLDTDCEVLANIEPIFDLLVADKLCMVKDVPLWKRRKGNIYNSGVVGVIGKPNPLYKWTEAIRKSPKRGDQETLHHIDPNATMIHDLPQEYNWLRLTLENDKTDSPDKKIMHWTGRRGKERIKAKL
jgi:hypothetical protein